MRRLHHHEQLDRGRGAIEGRALHLTRKAVIVVFDGNVLHQHGTVTILRLAVVLILAGLGEHHAASIHPGAILVGCAHATRQDDIGAAGGEGHTAGSRVEQIAVI